MNPLIRNNAGRCAASKSRHCVGVSDDFIRSDGLEIKCVTTAERNLSTTIALPKGLTYVPGSARMDGAAFAEPEISGDMLVFRAGDTSGKWTKSLAFEVKGASSAGMVLQAMTQFQSADGETRRLPPVRVALDVRWSAQLVLSSDPQIIQYNQIV